MSNRFLNFNYFVQLVPFILNFGLKFKDAT